MKKKNILTAILVIAIFAAVYGMKVYTDSYKNKNSIVQSNKSESEKNQSTPDKDKEEKQVQETTDYYKSTDFTLKDLQGKTVKLSDFKGKKVFLNFWATWCGPCKREIPDMIKFQEEIKDDNIVILAVNIGDSKSKVEDFVKKNNINFTVLLDEKQQVAIKYNVSGIPTTYLIDENGKLVKWTTGAMEIYMMRDFIK
ncbi:TlpA disulfide reductase family protein [Haloimpatiens lingqiaonensis]|uniref:TlpA disulfide reductase family protein n=1 Tax=Haloimpatiens lingqiaonensis TaxID=1380675 RepID=UPI0010FF55DB|nr:TlpA disulfide reductase family protein [Haloimpatiens lingqiaonensis]